MTTEPDGDIEFTHVEPPDRTARAAALALGKSRGLGTLHQVAAWVSACQGHCPPRGFSHPRLVVFAADHGIAARGVSADPAGTTAHQVTALENGALPAAVFATVAGTGLRVVDVGLDAGEADPSGSRVRRSSGAIDVEDALTDDEVRAAVRVGVDAADAEVDAGADLLVAGALGVGGSTPASTVVCALTGIEPVAVIGRGSGIDDAAWMRKAAAVRDALRRGRPFTAEPIALLRTVGGADLAALAGFLAQASTRRTPVVFDGLIPAAAALIAEELAPGAREWWLAAQTTPEPAYAIVLDHLGLEPLLDLKIAAPAGAGAVAALPLIFMAAQAVSALHATVSAP